MIDKTVVLTIVLMSMVTCAIAHSGGLVPPISGVSPLLPQPQASLGRILARPERAGLPLTYGMSRLM